MNGVSEAKEQACARPPVDGVASTVEDTLAGDQEVTRADDLTRFAIANLMFGAQAQLGPSVAAVSAEPESTLVVLYKKESIPALRGAMPHCEHGKLAPNSRASLATREQFVTKRAKAYVLQPWLPMVPKLK